MAEYKEGDTLTIVPRLIGSQASRIRGVLVKDRDDTGEWTIRPEGIRYAYDFNQDDWVIEEIAEADPLPTEPGYYLDKDFGLWAVEKDGYRAIDAAVKGTSHGALARKYAPFTRLRPESEVSEKDLEFYLAIGTDPEKLRSAAITLAKAGISGDEDIEAMVRSWHAERLRWLKLADLATSYAEGRG